MQKDCQACNLNNGDAMDLGMMHSKCSPGKWPLSHCTRVCGVCVSREPESVGGEVWSGEACRRQQQVKGCSVTAGSLCRTAAAQHCTQVCLVQ